MRQNDFVKKLNLKKITIAHLTENEMRTLLGGDDTLPDSVTTCTAKSGLDTYCSCKFPIFVPCRDDTFFI